MPEGACKAWTCLVRGAAVECEYLDDLTTRGTKRTGHTNTYDWDELIPLHAREARPPEKKVPGLQIDGYFLDDDSSTVHLPENPYGNKKLPYDSQFVIRLPYHWNRKLVIAIAPGNRGQYSSDFIISDFVLSKGYAFASTDKGNSGLRFYTAGQGPGDAVFEWHRRINQLTQATKEACEEYYGEGPVRTYITGNSNGGYATRYALENHPDLYDGGVDWQGPLWIEPESLHADRDDKGPNLLTFLPTVLKYYLLYVNSTHEDERQEARDKIIEAGFPGSVNEDSPEVSETEKRFLDALWEYHYRIYWGATQRIYRQVFDPYYPGAEAAYNYAERLNSQNNPFAQEVKDAVKRISLTGAIGKPLITVHGTLDALIPIKTSSDKYAELVDGAGRTYLHRYYRIEGGTHLDSLYDHPRPDNPDPLFRENLWPILPCYKACFGLLERWVEEGRRPRDRKLTVPKPTEGDIVNECPTLEKLLTED